MANIFQDVGRSSLFQTGQGVFRDVMAVGQQEMAGNQAALQAQEAQRRTAIMQAEEARRMQEDLRKQEAYAQEKAFNEKPFNIKFSPLLAPYRDTPEYPEREAQLRAVFGADEMGNTTHGNVVRGTTEMMKSPEMMKQWFKPRLDMLEAEIHANNDKLYKAKVAGDEEAVKKLTGIQSALQDQYLMKSGEYGKKILQVEKALAPAWKEAVDPSSPTGYRYVDQNTGATGSPAAAPRAAVEINFDKDTIKGAIKTLPALKEKAKSSNNGIARIDRMLGLIEKGAGGRVGQVKAWLAPTLEAFGYKSQGLAEAQMYETLSKLSADLCVWKS